MNIALSLEELVNKVPAETKKQLQDFNLSGVKIVTKGKVDLDLDKNELNPNIKIVGADPYGSILGGGNEIYPYKVEGIGYDFFPDVLDNSLVDEYIKVDDQNSFIMARRLIKEEGIQIDLNSQVEQVLVEKGAARGIRLADGSERK